MTTVTNPANPAQLGMSLLERGDLHSAELKFREMLARQPGDATSLLGLGIIGYRMGHVAPALALFDRAIAAAPGFAAAHVNRGMALVALQQFADALAAYDQALSLAPGLTSALVNKSYALNAAGRLDDAVATLEQVLAVLPDSLETLNNLGNLYKDQGRIDDAIAMYKRALAVNPNQQVAASNRIAALKLKPDISPAECLQQHRAWADRFEAVSNGAPILTNSAEPARPLRIGYVSPDCHTALPAFVDAIIAKHDRGAFQIFCYFNNPQDPQKLSALGIADTSRVMRNVDDQQVASLVHNDSIDILVDIAGHTGNNRLGVFARSPAPVQITWLDYLCTTGLDAMDYRITDVIADPPGSEAFHSEKLLRMPRTQWCWQPDATSPPVTSLPASRNGFVTFGSFNNAQKLTDATLALWQELLVALPEARLRVAGLPEGLARQRVLSALGCVPARVMFLPRVSVAEYRRAFDEVDIALDPLPFSGATTTLDALWQGLPVLTLPGASSCSRSTASLLTALDMQEWIATDPVDFVVRAARLCADREGLISLRASLRDRLRASSIVDATRFTRDLEGLYREAWVRWGEKRKAANGNAANPAGSVDALRTVATAIDGNRLDEAMALLKTLMQLRPQWEAAKQQLARACIAWSRAHPETLPAWGRALTERSQRQRVSAIICSIRPDYFANIRKRLGEHFAAHDFEVIGIHDAKSLCEGYNRGAMQARGDILIFCHDDIDLVHPDFGERLLRHLGSHDLVGVAGTSHLVSGEWVQAGTPHLHGQIVHRLPGDNGFYYFGSGLQQPVVENIQALDGVFCAVHRRVWEALKFDAGTFDGFHLYDIDFTYRAFKAGYKLAVPLDLLLMHFSPGRYDLNWHKYNRRFLDKFPELSNQLKKNRLSNLNIKLQSMEQVERLHTGLLHYRFGSPA